MYLQGSVCPSTEPPGGALFFVGSILFPLAAFFVFIPLVFFVIRLWGRRFPHMDPFGMQQRMLDRLASQEELWQQVAEARERAARAEGEAAALRELVRGQDRPPSG